MTLPYVIHLVDNRFINWSGPAEGKVNQVILLLRPEVEMVDEIGTLYLHSNTREVYISSTQAAGLSPADYI